MITIFQVITMEGWVEIMYMIDDTSGNIITIPYFCLIIIIGSFFLLNLILAVIMRVFTQNDEIEKMKFRQKKILEETKRLRKNPREYLIPLKIEKITRPKSASYRKRMHRLEEEGLDNSPGIQISSVEKRESKTKQTNSNFLRLDSFKKLKKKVDSSPRNGNQDEVQNSENESLLPLFELKKAKQEETKKDPNESKNALKKKLFANPMNKAVSMGNVTKITDRFTMYMSGLKPPQPNGQAGPRPSESRRSFSHMPMNEEKNKIFNKILNLKDSVTSQSQTISDEFKDEQSEKSEQKLEKQSTKKIPLPMNKRDNIFRRVSLSNYFNFSIMGAILVNTILLCMERYPMSEREQRVQEYFNMIFTIVFLIEMIIKIIGFGVKDYFRDGFNIFDCFVVVVSMADITISLAFQFDVEAGGAISAFRIFRLFRVIKLVKGWKRFQELVSTIVRSIKDVSNFSVLLFLFIFIYTLLGRELFAHKVKFNEEGNIDQDNPDAESPRNNFDSFVDAIITIFIVLTGEQWNKIMYDSYLYSKYVALAFFISLIMMGQMILLNLFLAILLENFNIGGKESQKDKDKTHYVRRFKNWIYSKCK